MIPSDDVDDIDEDNDEIVVAIVEDDEVVERQRQLFISQVDESRVSQVVGATPDHVGFRSLADRAARLGQLLGDKDGLAADLSRDILSDLFMVSFELRKDPTSFVRAVLSMMPVDEQLEAIAKLQDALTQRQTIIISEVI